MGQKMSSSIGGFSNKHLVGLRDPVGCGSTLSTPLHLAGPNAPISGVGSAFHRVASNNNNNNAIGPNQYPTIFGRSNYDEPERPARLDMLLDMPAIGLDVQKLHGWNTDDRSLNLFVVENDARIVHRHPVAQSTDAVRGLVGYTKGLHVWEINWPLRQRGTHAVVGVATQDALLHSNGYQPLVGSTEDSWGWDLGRNLLYHDLKSQAEAAAAASNARRANQPQQSPEQIGEMYNHQFSYDQHFVVPENFLVVLDMDEGTLSFMANGQYLGVAFRNLKGKCLYPMVSSVWGHCEIIMRYINGITCKYTFLVRKRKREGESVSFYSLRINYEIRLRKIRTIMLG